MIIDHNQFNHADKNHRQVGKNYLAYSQTRLPKINSVENHHSSNPWTYLEVKMS